MGSDLCRYCGLPLTWPRTDDPRSEECSACHAKAQAYEDSTVTAADIFEDEENQPWEM
jgi:nitrate/TMAO reductase-like tetraheme cytochrome c subunit